MRVASLRVLSVGIVTLSLLIAGCDDRSSTTDGSAAAEQPSDLKPTRLTGPERQGFAAECRRTWDNAPQNRGKPTAINSKDARDLERICDCFVDQLEDRTTKLEFLIAMEVIRTANSAFGEPNLRPLQVGASKIGVTAARFQEIHVDARKIGASAIKSCVERVISSR